jgi:glutamine synthetase
MTNAVSQLGDLLAEEHHGSEEDHMQFCATKLLSTMAEIRTEADALEVEIADDLWPLPSYHEMLNIK